MAEHNTNSGSSDFDRGRAFMRLYVSHERRVYAFIFTLVHDWNAADDILQETAQVMWSKFHEFDPDSDFMAWALCIARNKVMTYMRSQGRRRAFSARLAAQLDQRALDYAERDDDLQAALRVCLGKLSERDRHVSSANHRFVACPDTSNIYYYCVVSGGRMLNWNDGTYAPLILNGQAYGSLAHPAISLHANLGVTFDLDAIRGTLPGLRIQGFQSLCGISAEAPRSAQGATASFWVLVDGQVRFAQKIHQDDPAVSVAFALRDEDRFLTLVTTDDAYIGDDYCLFAEPALELGPLSSVGPPGSIPQGGE